MNFVTPCWSTSTNLGKWKSIDTGSSLSPTPNLAITLAAMCFLNRATSPLLLKCRHSLVKCSVYGLPTFSKKLVFLTGKHNFCPKNSGSLSWEEDEDFSWETYFDLCLTWRLKIISMSPLLKSVSSTVSPSRTQWWNSSKPRTTFSNSSTRPPIKNMSTLRVRTQTEMCDCRGYKQSRTCIRWTPKWEKKGKKFLWQFL